MHHFRGVFIGLLLALILSLLGLWQASSWAGGAAAEDSRLLAELQAGEEKACQSERLLKERERGMPSLRDFRRAWGPYLVAASQEADLAVGMRTRLEGLAQRKLSLVTDQVTAPEAARLMFGKRQISVQRVSLRASGETLVPLLIWLGEAEAAYPLARVESWELSASPGPGSTLKLCLAHPLKLAVTRKDSR